MFTLIVSLPDDLTPSAKGPIAFQTQLQHEGTHNPQESFLEHEAQLICKVVSQSLTSHLHQKAILTSFGVIVDLPNTQRQKGETKIYAKMKEQEMPPEKELDEMEAIKKPAADFKTIVIRMLKYLREECMLSVRT